MPYLIAAVVVATLVVHLFVVPFVLWIGYLASTHLDKLRVAGLLSRRARQMGAVVVGLTGLVDVYANFTSATPKRQASRCRAITPWPWLERPNVAIKPPVLRSA